MGGKKTKKLNRTAELNQTKQKNWTITNSYGTELTQLKTKKQINKDSREDMIPKGALKKKKVD